jgi:DNA repair protein RecO (recombination protein O)
MKKLICTCLFREHGLYKGTIKSSGRSRSQVQVGNIMHMTWSARLPEHLGSLYGELIKPLSMQIINDRVKLAAIASINSIVEDCLPEKLAETKIYDGLANFLLTLRDSYHWLENYLLLEIKILEELGYGLSLNKCAVTAKTEGLYYVSPRTGMSVTKEVGDEYKDKLLLLPKFYVYAQPAEENDIISAFRLNEYFIKKFLYQLQDKNMPATRAKFFEYIANISCKK